MSRLLISAMVPLTAIVMSCQEPEEPISTPPTPSTVEVEKTPYELSLERKMLFMAQHLEFLGEEASASDLTNEVRQKLSNHYMVRDMIDKGYLSEGISIQDVPDSVRYKYSEVERINWTPYGEAIPWGITGF